MLLVSRKPQTECERGWHGGSQPFPGEAGAGRSRGWGHRGQRNRRVVPVWTAPRRSLVLKGDTQKWPKGEVGVLKTGNNGTCLGAEGSHSIERRKLTAQDRGVIDGGSSLRRAGGDGTRQSSGFGHGEGRKAGVDAEEWQVSVER